MKFSTFRFGFVNGSILLSFLLASIPSTAEIIPDNTLPNNSTVTEGNLQRIREGTQRGQNLFHSFEKFSIESDNTARFEHDSSIQNIITRVTGSANSTIKGTIQTLINGTTDKGSANLFIINPKGIIFGEKASLDIGGSFIGSTADSIKFADGTEFSATAPQSSLLLTVSVPVGLQFGSNPREITNSSTNNPNGRPNNSADLPIGLEVIEGKTLALVGGNLSLKGSLTARKGRIELGSVAGNSLVSLTEREGFYTLEYTNVQNFGDITLENTASVDASGEGGGAIQVWGKNINLTNSFVFAFTEGSTPGKNLVINASESLKLSEGTQIITAAEGTAKAGDVIVEAPFIELSGNSGFAAQANGNGNGGNIIIDTRQLSIKDGAVIDASTFAAGNAGNIEVTATDTIQLEGAFSAINAQVAERDESTGSAGTITIRTRQLTLKGGAMISSSTFAKGDGGTVDIEALEFITLTGSRLGATEKMGSSGIFATANTETTTGNPGKLDIVTGQLTVENDGRISAKNIGTGQTPGNLTLNVKKLVIRGGGTVQADTSNTGPGGTLKIKAEDSVEVSGTGTLGGETVESTITTQAESSGKAGELIIDTSLLRVKDNANVTVSSTGTGAAGNLTVTADRIELDHKGKLIGETRTGANAGNITLNLKKSSLFLRRQSQISASAGPEAPADSGNILINAPNGFVVAIPEENSDITANAFRGNGGNVTINSKGIFGIERRDQLTDKSDITVSSEFGVPGNINLTNPENDGIQNSLTELPQNLINSEMLIASSCVVRGNERNGTFFITGSGGLPYRPGDAVPSAYPTGDVQSVADDTSTTKPTRRWKIGDPLIEPTGVYRLANGQRILSRECGR